MYPIEELSKTGDESLDSKDIGYVIAETRERFKHMQRAVEIIYDMSNGDDSKELKQEMQSILNELEK